MGVISANDYLMLLFNKAFIVTWLQVTKTWWWNIFSYAEDYDRNCTFFVEDKTHINASNQGNST